MPAADVVFIGDDEAHALFGTTDSDALAGFLVTRRGQQLVLKRGAGEATVVTHDGCTSAPASRVAVVDLTGAGDASAAGYLAASVWEWRTEGRLRLGHYLAARVVAVVGDIGPAVARSELHRSADSVQETVPETVEEPQG
jgi:2-dehydro-3-deoxygluconokinase